MIVLTVFCTGCGKEHNNASNMNKSATSDDWVIEMYICGSDLEHKIGSATKDIEELLKEKPPANVKFVIEVGGTKKWRNNVFKENEIGRYLYDKDGLKKIEAVSDADMGQSKTLADFLEFSKKNFDAEHRVLIIWDHGGGTVGGVCMDERTKNRISLNGLHGALATVYDINLENPPYEIIGFDACLMATLSVANALTGFSHYMIASQESEPGNGWNYTGIVKGFKNDISSSGKALGKVICDSYIQGCKEYGTEKIATLSVIDLTKIPNLMGTYTKLGQEALRAAGKSPRKFFSVYTRQALKTQSYGGNSLGYFNMIDLGGFTKATEKILPQNSSTVLSALNSAVVYKVNGSGYKSAPCGISCYYPYTEHNSSSPQAMRMKQFNDIDAASPQHRALYTFLHTGKMPKTLPSNIMGFFGSGRKEPIYKTLPDESIDSTVSFDISSLKNQPLKFGKNGEISCQIPLNIIDNVSEVHCVLMHSNSNERFIRVIGIDNDLNINWNTGLVNDKFIGTWPMLEGHPIFLRLSHVGNGFNLYSVPIKLNGEIMYMQVYYNHSKKEYKILGALEGVNDDELASRNLVQLKEGDTVTTLQYQGNIPFDNSELRLVEVATFRLSENFFIADSKLVDGQYYYFFEFVDPNGKKEKSNFANIKINGQNISIRNM